MKHRGWNPTRRNRNIGTEKSGYSKNNKLVIPERWRNYRIYWEHLVEPVVCPLEIKGQKITLFVESPREGHVHSCTPQDIIKVLELIDEEYLVVVELLVLRQPKKKEEILAPAWGRFVYFAELGKYSGSGVYIETWETNRVLKWGKSMDPFSQKELLSLESDDHRIEKVKRGYNIYTTPETVRNTQLFRTLPHEVGHAVDYLENLLIPQLYAETEAESDYIGDVFRSKPSLDKEEFANRYAREFYRKWSEKGYLPFNRIYDIGELEQMGLNPLWFQS